MNRPFSRLNADRRHLRMMIDHPRNTNPPIIESVKTVSIPRHKDQAPKQDPYYPAAVQRTREEVRRLRRAGVIDSEGRRIRQDLPPDMREGHDRDFGG